MEKRIAQVSSILFHPYFLTIYGLIILYNSGLYISFLPPKLKRWILLIVILNTALIPLSFIPFYLKMGLIKNLGMHDSKERMVPLLINTILFYITYYILTRFRIPSPVTTYILLGAIVSFAALIITWKWKISLHMMGIGALTGAFLAIAFRYGTNITGYIVFFILVSGILGFSRLRNNDHDGTQVGVGYVMGFMIGASIMYFF
jgi:hypothetical protein